MNRYAFVDSGSKTAVQIIAVLYSQKLSPVSTEICVQFSLVAQTLAPQETSVQRAKVYEDVLVAISDVKIGDRTPGVNPQGNDSADESCFVEIPHYIYSLRHIKGLFGNSPYYWGKSLQIYATAISE